MVDAGDSSRTSSRTCGAAAFDRATHHFGGKGFTLSPDVNALISVIKAELGGMLAGRGPQYLIPGPDWESLRSKQGSALDMFVSHVCHCGIRAVRSANRWASRMESCEEGAVHQALPLPRGRKVRSLDPLGTAGGQVSVRPGDSADECAAVASDSEAPLMRQVAGVRGAFLPSADGNARQHAFCVVLGHIYVWAATNGVPGRSVEALLAQLSLANVDIGQKYHHRNSLGRYGTVASQVASVAILHAPGSGTRPGTFHTRVRGELFGMA